MMRLTSRKNMLENPKESCEKFKAKSLNGIMICQMDTKIAHKEAQVRRLKASI
jgi:hypothetical protein